MADSFVRAWWRRLKGRLIPNPCPYRHAWILDAPFRAWLAGPGRIVGAFGLRRGERALEIGPGTGYYSVEAARLLGPEGHLVCLDVQHEMLREVGRRLRDGGSRSFSLIRGDACRLPIRSGCVDHVFLVTVLGEIPDRRRGLEEVCRVLRGGGRLSVSEQLPDPDFVTLGWLRRELPRLGFVEETTRGRFVYTSTWRQKGQVSA